MNEKSFNSQEYSNLGNNSSNQLNSNDNVDNSSSISKYFNTHSLDSPKKKYGKSLAQIVEQNISEYKTTNEIYEKEASFHILDKSTFSFHTNRKGIRPSIIFEEISVSHYQNRNFSFEEIKNMTAEDTTLEDNYKKFLNVLDKIISTINDEFSFQYKLKIILKFRTIDIQNSKYIIKCNYEAEIPGEDPYYYKDDNILENGINNGLKYLLNEINDEVHNNLNYVD